MGNKHTKRNKPKTNATNNKRSKRTSNTSTCSVQLMEEYSETHKKNFKYEFIVISSR